MKYDKELLERVQRELESDKIRLEAEADVRRKRVYSAFPRVAEIDAILRTTALDIIRATFGKGGDTAALLLEAKEKNTHLRREREEILKAAGIPENFADVKYTCDICEDTGHAGGELCSCVRKRYRRAAAAVINSKLNVAGADFSRFDISLYPEKSSGTSPREHMREVLAFCRDYSANFGDDSENLFFNGGTGLGKSLLASCVAKTVAENGFSVVYGTAFSVLGVYEDVKFGRSDADTSVYETCDLLILDDVGCEMTTPFSVAALYNLIAVRLSGDKKTIVVSSLADSEIKKRYGAQLHSRLCGDFVNLRFLGSDVRLIR